MRAGILTPRRRRSAWAGSLCQTPNSCLWARAADRGHVTQNAPAHVFIQRISDLMTNLCQPVPGLKGLHDQHMNSQVDQHNQHPNWCFRDLRWFTQHPEPLSPPLPSSLLLFFPLLPFSLLFSPLIVHKSEGASDAGTSVWIWSQRWEG